MVLAEPHHRARLRTFGALRMLRDKAYLIADGKRREPVFDDAVAMEIDLLTAGAQNEAAIPIGMQPHNPSVVGHLVQLDVATRPPGMVFQEPAGGIERITDRDIDIFMGMPFGAIAADDDLPSWHFQIDANLEQIALLVTRMAALDNATAGGDPVEKRPEFGDALFDTRRDRVGPVHMAKSDLQRQLHCILLVTATAGGDPVEKRPEFGDALFDTRRDRVGPVHMAKSDLQRQLHCILLVTATASTAMPASAVLLRRRWAGGRAAGSSAFPHWVRC